MPYSYNEGRYIHAFPALPDFEVERNLLTFATSRSGKGATQIIPWLRENPDINALVIDPKNEALIEALEARSPHRAMHALDPFGEGNTPEHIKAKLNILDFIDPKSKSAFKEINAIADGMVMKHDPKGEHWDGGGIEILAGFIAHVLSHDDYKGERSLITVRRLLTLQGDDFDAVVDKMALNHSCGGLPATAASKLTNTGNEANHFISVAVSNTKWLNDPHMVDCLSSSTFDLRDIKSKKIDVFLVLPVDSLNDYGRFLRLFVRMALYHMMQRVDGELKAEQVYFILDEAFSLGYISEVESSMSSMPGFGLHVWTFWQDINQLWKRYDRQGAGTFFANSDARYFFGVDDPETARFVSEGAGLVQEHELGVKPPDNPEIDFPEKSKFHDATHNLFSKERREYAQAMDGKDGVARARFEHDRANKGASYSDAMNDYQFARNSVNRPRVTPDEVQRITRRSPTRKIAENALVLREGTCYKKPLIAYFEDKENIEQSVSHDGEKTPLSAQGEAQREIYQKIMDDIKVDFVNPESWMFGGFALGICTGFVQNISWIIAALLAAVLAVLGLKLGQYLEKKATERYTEKIVNLQRKIDELT